MFKAVLIIGLYGYLIFLLGILGLFYKNVIITFSSIYIFTIIFIYLKYVKLTFNLKKHNLSKYSKFFLSIILIQTLVNLIGALGPELSFDALWYHLTIPKIFLENHRIFHIPGDLLYYSDLPKNIDLIYLLFLSFSNEIGVKLIHYGFGVLCLFALYKLSRKFLNQEMSLLSCLVFYSNLVVGWQSITAYIDLGITFFEIIALYQFVLWIEKKDIKFIFYSATSIGFALVAKISAFNSIAIFLLLIFLIYLNKRINFSKYVKSTFYFIFFPILISSPWFIFSYMNTKNPFYPLFENSFNLTFDRNPISILNLFLFSSDPINPLYLIFIPLIIFFFKKFDYKSKILISYCLFSLSIWFITSSMGGSRFILPYLPAYSIIVLVALGLIKHKKLKEYLIFVIVIIAVSSIGYRFVANYKYVPVILGLESKVQFLSDNLNFSFGDFYDTDGYFQKNIKPIDKVLLFGFHNLYYIDFPYMDSSWVKKGDTFNYIATQNLQIPQRFSDWKQIYYNDKTMVKLYSKEGRRWVY